MKCKTVSASNSTQNSVIANTQKIAHSVIDPLQQLDQQDLFDVFGCSSS